MNTDKQILTILLAMLFLGSLVLITGCVTVSGESGNSGELSPEMEQVLANVTTVLQEGTDKIQTELSAAAVEIGENPHDTEKIRQILRSYYVDNSWVSLIAYYDTHSGGITVPVQPSDTAEKILRSVTEKDFASENIRIGFNQMQEGTTRPVTTMYVPVYTHQGEYSGYIVMWHDPDTLISYLLTGQEGMDTYGLWIGDSAGKNLYYRTSPDYVNCPENTAYLSGWKTVRILGTPTRVCLTDDGGLQNRKLKDVAAESLKTESVELYSYATSHSKTAALTYISQKKSDTYLYFAYDTAGNVLARSDGRYINQNHQDLHDAFGVQITDTMMSRMRQGGGYLYLMIPTTNAQSPAEAIQDVSYLLPIDSSWFIGVRAVVNPDRIPIHNSVGQELLSLGREAVGYAWEYGKDATVEMISRDDSVFLRNASSDRNLFLGAVTMEGEILPAIPMSEGKITRALGLVDTYGASVGRQALILAKQGGGLLYAERIAETAEGTPTVEVYLIAVTPVDNEWSIFTGSLISTRLKNTSSV